VNGGFATRNLPPGYFGITDNKLAKDVLILKTPNSMAYQANNGYINFLRINQGLFRSLKEYIIDITPPGPVYAQLNSLKAAQYNSTTDVLLMSRDEDPLDPVRDEGNPSNLHLQEDPSGLMEGGRRSTRKNRRRRQKQTL
jgi:hypothetical protein